MEAVIVSGPKPPDPVKTAAAQAGLNQNTAITQQLLNMTDQVNPWGSVDYDQNGSTSFVDSSGKMVSLPRFTQTTTLSPAQQAIFDKSQGAQTNLADIAQSQSGRVNEALSTPFQFNNQDAADWSYDLASSRILPQQQQAQQALRSRLVNSGIHEGTAAYDRALSRQGMQDTDQLNQLALTGRGQAFGESLATRNQPINELTALLSGSQVSNPAQMSGPTPQTGVGGVDYTGLVNQNYQAKAAQHQAGLGGLFGLLGAGAQAAAFASDARLKTAIERLGTLANGLGWYAYRYVWDTPETRREGVLAQDVRRIMPEAIVPLADGHDAVNYGMVLA